MRALRQAAEVLRQQRTEGQLQAFQGPLQGTAGTKGLQKGHGQVGQGECPHIKKGESPGRAHSPEQLIQPA